MSCVIQVDFGFCLPKWKGAIVTRAVFADYEEGCGRNNSRPPCLPFFPNRVLPSFFSVVPNPNAGAKKKLPPKGKAGAKGKAAASAKGKGKGKKR